MYNERPLSTGEVARHLHVTPVAVLLWIRAGKLRAARVPGGRYRIARADFRKFLADNHLPVPLEAPAPRRVLVVDDEPSVREALEAALQAKGCAVVLAKDGREALRTIRQERFDLIFLDILLPSVGGASVLKAIQRRDPEAVVIIITGFPHHAETLAALQHGPAMLLAKPIKLADIDAVFRIVVRTEKTA